MKNSLRGHPFFKHLETISRLDSWQAREGATFPVRQFLSALQKAHPFMFSPTVVREKLEAGWKMKDLGEIVREFSLPFSRSLYLLQGAQGITVTKDGVPQHHVAPRGYLVEELSPEKFRIYSLSHIKFPPGIQGQGSIEGPLIEFCDLDLGLQYSMDTDEANMARAIVHSLTQAISVKRIGVEHISSFNIKSRQTMTGLTTFKFPNLVHIADKVEYDYTAACEDGEINWEFSGFWRGHWRAFYVKNSNGDNVKDSKGRNVVDYGRSGKDRAGNEKVIPGYSWVREHIKGDPALAQIKKRVVVPQS